MRSGGVSARNSRLKTLPPKLGGNAESLKVLDLSHNRFENWGDLVGPCR